MPNGITYDFEDISNPTEVPNADLADHTGQIYLPAARIGSDNVDLQRVSVAQLLSFVQSTIGMPATTQFRIAATPPTPSQKKEGVPQLYLYQDTLTYHDSTTDSPIILPYLNILYFHSGILTQDWQVIRPPRQLYSSWSRPDSEAVFYSYQYFGSTVNWIVSGDHSGTANHPPQRGTAYFNNASNVRDTQGNLIPDGADSTTTLLPRGCWLRLIGSLTWTDTNGVEQTRTISRDISIWRMLGVLQTENSPKWQYSLDGTTWHDTHQTTDTLARQLFNDGTHTPTFDLHQDSPTSIPATTTNYGIADTANAPVGTAQIGTLGEIWTFPATTAQAPKQYFDLPQGKTVVHILNVALGGAQETLTEWQQVTINSTTRYVRQVLVGRTGQYRVIFQ